MAHACPTSENTLVFTGKPPHYQKNQQAEYSCTNTGRRDAGGIGWKMGWENGKSNHAKLIDPQSPTFTTFATGCGRSYELARIQKMSSTGTSILANISHQLLGEGR